MSSLYVLLAGVLWGIIPIFVDVLQVHDFSSMQVVAVRATFTAVLLGLILLVGNRSAFRIRLKDFGYFIGTGIGSIVFFNYCYFMALELIGSSAIPALLMYTAPAIVMVLSVILFHEKFTKLKLTALVLTMVGLGLVTGTGHSLFGSKLSLEAILYGLGAGLGYALYSIFSKFIIDRYSPVTITFYTFLVATCVTILLSGVMAKAPEIASIDIWPWAVGLALVSTISPFALYTRGLSGMEASRASILATVEPIVACIVGVLYYGDRLNGFEVVGILLVLGAIALLNKK